MSVNEEQYEYVKATVTDGSLVWEYQVEGFPSPGSMSHDEDVSEWSDEDIIDITAMILDVEDEQRDIIELIRE